MSGALALVDSTQDVLSIDALRGQVQVIQRVMHDVMHQDEHFGVIPGTKKFTLFKSGAEKLAFTFRLTREVQTTMTSLGNGHREYQAVVRLTHAPTGTFAGEGIGLCSTMESKYRYRGTSFEILDEPIPRDYKNRKDDYKRKGLGARQVDGEWKWVRMTGEKAENADIADTYNTVLKMAVKRAFIDAILAATAASDIFTQDLEEPVADTAPEPDPSTDPAFEARLNELRGELSSARNAGLLTQEQSDASMALLRRQKTLETLNKQWAAIDKKLDAKRAEVTATPTQSEPDPGHDVDDSYIDDPEGDIF